MQTRVLDRQTQLHEDGRIRIGHKVAGVTKEGKAYTRPAMLETFRLTSSSKSMLEFAAKVFGGEVRPWEEHAGQYELYTERSELKVAVSALHSISQAYELWTGGGCVRRCDGEMCHLITVKGKGKDAEVNEEDVPCLCDYETREAGTDQKNTCRFKTRLSVMLSESPALGRWRLETSGKIAGAEIPEILSMMEALGFTNGPVFCILTLTQQEIKRPGRPAEKFAVPVLSLDPNPPSMTALIHRVQQSAFAPLPEGERMPMLNASSTPQLASANPATPNHHNGSPAKPTPAENTRKWLVKTFQMNESQLRDMEAWLQGEEKPFVKSCADAKELGPKTVKELYEAIQTGVIVREEPKKPDPFENPEGGDEGGEPPAEEVAAEAEIVPEDEETPQEQAVATETEEKPQEGLGI